MSSPADKVELTFAVTKANWYTSSIRLPVAPFDSGTWTFVYANYGTVALSCPAVTSFAQVDSVELSSQPYNYSSGKTSGRFPPSRDWSTSCKVHDSLNNASRTVTLTVCFAAPRDEPKLLKEIAAANAPLLNSRSPNDVVFFFPRTNRELWSHSTALRTASAYFATLLDSGFKESNRVARQSTAAQDVIGDDDGSDSDAETDWIEFDGVRERERSSIAAGVQEVVVKESAYTTYRALLGYIHWGYISFAPLTLPSSCEQTRKAALTAAREQLERGTHALLPASPKSMYNLAQFVDMQQLAKLAFNNFSSQLTPKNVLYQLTTDIAVHDEVRAALVSFAAANWAEVRKTAILKELQKVEVLESLSNPLLVTSALAAIAEKCEQMSVD